MSGLAASPAEASPRRLDLDVTNTVSTPTPTPTPSTLLSATPITTPTSSSAFTLHPESRQAATEADTSTTAHFIPQTPANQNPSNQLATNLPDVSSEPDLSWLGPLIDDGVNDYGIPETASDDKPNVREVPALTAGTSPAPTRPAPSPPRDLRKAPEISAQIPRHTDSPNNDTDGHANNNNNNNNTSNGNGDPSRPQPATHLAEPAELISNQQSRKLSPGLAARLRALGLGSSKKSSSPSSANERVGRLPEDQILQIDTFWQFQQQRSAALQVDRRGRPWKGVGLRIPSRSDSKSKSDKDADNHSDADAVTPEDVDVPTIKILDSPGTDHPSELLQHEFEADEALDMDTNKYRLPDHTNGNGTKVTLDTRREHLERQPPSPPLDSPPPVPAKDSPPLATQPFNPDDYFNPLGLQRAGSIYTISRASFANQLEQLTSLQLPDAESLAGKVAAIPTAHAAVKALIGAAEQIRNWISKAAEVISGLDSDDDVEWSAAGGREGLEEVESATTKFEGLINVYVTAIEQLQNRVDIANVSTDDLTKAVTQMEAIMEEWTSIRSTLRSVRGQVEIAMEWEELWNVVLGEIESELGELSRLVFEMEERRHKSAMAIASGDAVDMRDLQTIAEEKAPAATRAKATNTRFSLTGMPMSPGSPSPTGPTISADDSSLLALFARMQPLRASLDFLPMRLSAFEARADRSFPTACDELSMRQEALDATYRKLEKDAEGLRKELGEDRWVLVFRGAARQAQKMTESVERSVARLREAVDAGMHLTNQPAFLKKIESYEAKKLHYGPAIDRVLLIIDRGVKDRLTVNGEILRLHTEMQAKWADIKNQIKETDIVMDELQADKRGSHLRDSISSMLSNDIMSVRSGAETPGSSPPSSIIMSGLGIDTRSPVSKSTSANRTRRSSSSVSSHLAQSGRRSSPATKPSVPRKPVPRLSTFHGTGTSTPGRESSATPNANRFAGSIPRPSSTMAHRPRWNVSTNTNSVDTGHNFKPLTLSTPSPYSKNKATSTPVRSHSSLAAPMSSRLPMRSPLRAASPSPSPQTPPRPVSKLNLLQGPPLSHRRPSLKADELGLPPRAASSMATTSRRTSMLPMPRFKKDVSDTGRASTPGPSPGPRFRRGNTVSSDHQPKGQPARWKY